MNHNHYSDNNQVDEFSPEMYFDTNPQNNDKTITNRHPVLLPQNDQSDQKEKSIEEIIPEFD
jgi:hypothetical protein